jgi:hypothetical protein
MLMLTVINYGFPIAHLMALRDTAIPVVRVGGSK